MRRLTCLEMCERQTRHSRLEAVGASKSQRLAARGAALLMAHLVGGGVEVFKKSLGIWSFAPTESRLKVGLSQS